MLVSMIFNLLDRSLAPNQPFYSEKFEYENGVFLDEKSSLLGQPLGLIQQKFEYPEFIVSTILLYHDSYNKWS
jgi:hypothetical protein